MHESALVIFIRLNFPKISGLRKILDKLMKTLVFARAIEGDNWFPCFHTNTPLIGTKEKFDKDGNVMRRKPPSQPITNRRALVTINTAAANWAYPLRLCVGCVV
jgi:hypothetical protein